MVDFFHWPKQGEWKFDPVYLPDPSKFILEGPLHERISFLMLYPGAMIAELQRMNIKIMVSIWPTVDKQSSNYAEMVEKGLLIQCERGIQTAFEFEGETSLFDATNPEAREYIWTKAKANYYDLGVRIFWLDQAEPEYSAYDFDNYRYFLGPNLSIGNIYPREYSRAFWEGMTAQGQDQVVNLVRCAWAGSQKYGALVWSGDMAGIPWWTTDIGGFHGGDPNDEAFRELFVRWFQWGAFCPVMRLHGDREPRQPQQGTSGGATCRSGAVNEVWSYGPAVYDICVKYMKIREDLRAYTRRLMEEAHQRGTPVMRTCFHEFPEDRRCWEVEDQHMFGDEYLVAPVMHPGMTQRQVYLPKGSWILCSTEQHFDGGADVVVDAPLESMPVFRKA